MIKINVKARKFLYLNFILQPLFQSPQNFYEKREGFGSGSGPVLVTNGSGRPKNLNNDRNGSRCYLSGSQIA